MEALFVGTALVLSFGAGVWLAPVLRGDYSEFKAWVEVKLHLAEQAAKDKALKVVNKL